jgi:biotin carboxylase
VHLVFIAPRFLENTNRYVSAFAKLDGLTLSVVSQDPERALPRGLRARVAGHYRVDNVLDEAQLARAIRGIERGVGSVDRVCGALEQLQMPMAEARDALGIEGVSAAVARNFRDKDRMKDVLRAHNLPVARSGLVHSSQALAQFIELVGYPVIVKPQAGLGARATFRLQSRDDLRALLGSGQGPSAQVPLQAEEFVRAREYTCETVTIRGEAVWSSGTRYLPSPLEVLESPWMKYCVLLPREEDAK